MFHIDPGSYFGNHVGSDRWNGVGFRDVYLAKETEPVHVFHFRTFKFDYEEDFTGPEMLLTEVNQAFAFAT